MSMCTYKVLPFWIKTTNLSSTFFSNDFKKYLELITEEWDAESYWKDVYTMPYIMELSASSRNEIAQEIKHTKKVFTVSFQTYSNYENNLVIRILLWMLENDFKMLRDKLYSAISPINQVVYKISNAMSK